MDQQLGPIRLEFKEDFFSLKKELSAIADKFNIPGLIGENQPYSNITEFLIVTFEQNKKAFDSCRQSVELLEQN